MIYYIDTSVLMSALAREAEAERILAWLADQEPGDMVISEWVATEFSAALSIKLRSRRIEADQQAEALAMFTRLRADVFIMLPIEAAHFRMAALLADRRTAGLRAGGALHLAVCVDHGATLCTLDRRLGKAGPALGIKTTLL